MNDQDYLENNIPETIEDRRNIAAKLALDETLPKISIYRQNIFMQNFQYHLP